MPLPGIATDESLQDYPNPVRESQTTLAFKLGGEDTLGVTDVPEDLVLVSALRRFENQAVVARGTETTGGSSTTTLTDSTADFLNWGVEVGDVVTNVTDSGALWNVDAIVSGTVLTVSLNTTGGGDDDWDSADAYTIAKRVTHQGARAQTIRKVRIVTDLDVYIAWDEEANASSHTFRLNAGEAMNEDGVRIVSRISWINVTTGETPTLRWWVLGT